MTPVDYYEQLMIAAAESKSTRVSKTPIKKVTSLNRDVPLRTLLRAAIQNEPDAPNTKYVSIHRLALGNLDDGTTALNAFTKTKIPGQEVRLYNQQIYCLPAGYSKSIIKAPGVVVTCNCPRWMFMWEVACFRHGCADIVYSNGQAPVQTNPTMRLGTCKHLIRVMSTVVSRSL